MAEQQGSQGWGWGSDVLNPSYPYERCYKSAEPEPQEGTGPDIAGPVDIGESRREPPAL